MTSKFEHHLRSLITDETEELHNYTEYKYQFRTLPYFRNIVRRVAEKPTNARFPYFCLHCGTISAKGVHP
jgi:hypothetical protein